VRGGEILKIMQRMKPKVAFICVHNSCRSQMAEALGKLFAGEVFESYSAGTELRPQINQDAVRTIKNLYNVDMNETQKSKLLGDIPEVDIVIKMGCNVICPFLPSRHMEDWGLEDPSGKSDEEFIKTAKTIEEKVKELARRIQNNEIDLTVERDIR
jgi:arsenate reductase (thioredoxin)